MHLDRHPDLLAELRGQVAHAETIVDAHPGQQPQADQSPAGLQGPARRVDVEPRRVVVAAGDVGAALADDVAGDVVAVARTDGRHPLAAIPQGHPVAHQLHRVGLHRPGVDHLQGIDAKRPASMLAGDRVELLGGERPEAGVQVARVVQDDDPLPRRGADRAEQVGPAGDVGVRGLRAGRRTGRR